MSSRQMTVTYSGKHAELVAALDNIGDKLLKGYYGNVEVSYKNGLVTVLKITESLEVKR